MDGQQATLRDEAAELDDAVEALRRRAETDRVRDGAELAIRYLGPAMCAAYEAGARVSDDGGADACLVRDLVEYLARSFWNGFAEKGRRLREEP